MDEKHLGFVINLQRRRDRLEAFKSNNAAIVDLIAIKPFWAVDGRDLQFDDELRKRIKPWDLEHLNDATLRGVVGCALSHLNVLKHISTMSEKFVFVFEDDAMLIRPGLHNMLRSICKRVPRDADLVWLNKGDGDRSVRAAIGRVVTRLKLSCFHVLRPSFARWPATTIKTMEAYLITPRCAGIIHMNLADEIWAIDMHIRSFFERRPDLNCFVCSPPIFTQVNRRDFRHPTTDS